MNRSPRRRASRRGFLAFAAGCGALAIAGRAAAQPALVEGQNYTRLRNPQPVDSGRKVEVLEFFSYGCPHCRDLDPELVAWKKTLPADVEFRRVPVDFGREQWRNLGKVYYTLEALDVEERLTPEFFVALHDKRAPLFEPKAFLDWIAAKGVDRKKAEDTFNSFGVTSKMNRALTLAKNYSVQSVPLVIVDGKFQLSSDKVGSHANMPAAINQLIAKARAERPKS
ncbi:MAG: thiol:disulfide interchange protein [Betaproteobacteria bacterium]|nr:MAG: thiol:disulfide interchange protein [Betaproteobacteria bacterium]